MSHTLASLAPSALLALTPSRPDWAPPSAPRPLALAVLALHLALAALLLQAGRVAVARLQPTPVQVSLIAERAPSPPPPAALPRGPLPSLQVPVLVPLPEIQTAAPAPAAPLPRSVAATPSPVASAPVELRPSTPSPPTPKAVSASALRYRVEPAIEVPRLSRRAGESGRVGLRVLFDTQGRPREIQLARSSGFARLDAQAQEAMQAARIQPFVEDGQAIEVIATAWLEYELD